MGKGAYGMDTGLLTGQLAQLDVHADAQLTSVKKTEEANGTTTWTVTYKARRPDAATLAALHSVASVIAVSPAAAHDDPDVRTTKSDDTFAKCRRFKMRYVSRSLLFTTLRSPMSRTATQWRAS